MFFLPNEPTEYYFRLRVDFVWGKGTTIKECFRSLFWYRQKNYDYYYYYNNNNYYYY